MVERGGPAFSVAALPRVEGGGRGLNREGHHRPDPRRFYDQAGVKATGAGFEVRLDGRVPRSPGGRPLLLPTLALAELVAAEWNAQKEVIALASMPATRLAYTALDMDAAARKDSVASIVRYARTDLLCYCADGPASLVERQTAAWGPLLAWAREDLGLAFSQAAGVVHQEQPPRTLARTEQLALGLDDFALAGGAFATALFGSAILAFAVMKGRIDASAAYAASRVDEAFQEERWGLDADAAARSDRLAVDARMLGGWFAALGL